MTVFLYIISLLLAALMGFAVHRASLCMVRTVAEILSTRYRHPSPCFAGLVAPCF